MTEKLSPLSVDVEQMTITLPHLGLTTRTILAAASEVAWEGIDDLPDAGQRKKYNWRPKFKLIYKKVCIGQIYLKSYQQYKASDA